MNIDFHYGVVYIAARIGGMAAGEAITVAHACQYVDDATTSGILRFSGGETFERFATAHKLFDYTNAENDQNRLVWDLLSESVSSKIRQARMMTRAVIVDGDHFKWQKCLRTRMSEN